MAIYSNSVSIVSGKAGGSAVAAAAYQSADRLQNDLDGRTRDYENKDRVIDTDIIKPENAPEWCSNRERLWNEVEKKEGINGRYARRHILALPRELSADQQRELVRNYCQTELVDQGMVADYAIHNDPDGNNPHAHILTTTRSFDESGKWMAKSKNVTDRDEMGNAICIGRDKNGRKRYQHKCIKTNNWDEKETLQRLRDRWADLSNDALEKAGSFERVSSKSHAERKLDIYPTIHLGPASAALEKAGISTERGEFNRAIKWGNNTILSNNAAVRVLEREAIKTEGVYYNDGLQRRNECNEVSQTAIRISRKRGFDSKVRYEPLAGNVLMQNVQTSSMAQIKTRRRERINDKNILQSHGRSSVEHGRRKRWEIANADHRLRHVRANFNNRSGRKEGSITVCRWCSLSKKEKESVARGVGLKNFQEQYARQFCMNSIFARSQSGAIRLLPINRTKAVEAGLLRSGLNSSKQTPQQVGRLTKKLSPEIAGHIKAAKRDIKSAGAMKGAVKAVDGVLGALNENKTKGQHIKQVKDNVKEIFKTPKKIVSDMLTNPILGILKLPFRAMEAIGNGMSAIANTAAAATKDQGSNGNYGLGSGSVFSDDDRKMRLTGQAAIERVRKQDFNKIMNGSWE